MNGRAHSGLSSPLDRQNLYSYGNKDAGAEHDGESLKKRCTRLPSQVADCSVHASAGWLAGSLARSLVLVAALYSEADPAGRDRHCRHSSFGRGTSMRIQGLAHSHAVETEGDFPPTLQGNNLRNNSLIVGGCRQVDTGTIYDQYGNAVGHTHSYPCDADSRSPNYIVGLVLLGVGAFALVAGLAGLAVSLLRAWRARQSAGAAQLQAAPTCSPAYAPVTVEDFHDAPVVPTVAYSQNATQASATIGGGNTCRHCGTPKYGTYCGKCAQA